MSRTPNFSAKAVAAGLSFALLAVAAPAFGNSETIVRETGAEFTSERVVPWVLDVDLRELPRTQGWKPGDAITIVPEGLYEDRAVEADPNWVDPLVRNVPDSASFSSEVIVSFQTHPFGAGWPPDVNGDVGPNYYISMVNASNFAIWNKDGSVAVAAADLSDLWTANGGTPSSQCADGDGDPIVRYDSLADRWMLTEFDLGNDNLCFYISRTSDPVTGGWFVYDFSAPSFPDYPQYGVWDDAWYVTTFEFPSLGLYAFDRDNMLAGNAATFQRFTVPALGGTSPRVTRMLPLDLDGGVAAPAGTPGILTRTVDNTQDSSNPTDRIEIWELDVDFATPGNSTLTQQPDIPLTAFTLLPCAPSVRDCIDQPGTAVKIDGLFNRPLRRAQYRNFGTHESFVMTQVVDAGSGVAGKRWWELRRTPAGAGNWSIHQEGTYSPDSAGRFMGSMAMDAAGNIALGYSLSSDTILPAVAATGRRSGDPLGVMTMDELIIKAGEGVQTNTQRWGDYSAMNVDPADGRTFWYTNEIVGSTGFWTTWVGSFTISDELFSDGFESGDTSAWSVAFP
ncbi:MAG: hypothetical protein AAFX50_01345 [Acidobacteriota bacterium]